MLQINLFSTKIVFFLIYCYQFNYHDTWAKHKNKFLLNWIFSVKRLSKVVIMSGYIVYLLLFVLTSLVNPNPNGTCSRFLLRGPIFLADVSDCSKYYVCDIRGFPKRYSCSTNKLFDSVLNVDFFKF